jgi:hypothetical protein
MITLTLTIKQKVTVKINPRSFAGYKSNVGNVVWSVESGDSIVVPSSDGFSAVLTASDKPGTTVFLVGAVPVTYMNWASFESDSPLDVVKDENIYNHISLKVVENRVDTSHGEATNLGLEAGSPSKK